MATKLEAAREMVRLLGRDLEAAIRSRFYWRSRFYEERSYKRALEEDLRRYQRDVQARVESFESLAKDATERALNAGMRVAELKVTVAALEKSAQDAADDRKALEGAMNVVRAEIDRVLVLAPGKPSAWLLGEMKRIRLFADDGETTASGPTIFPQAVEKIPDAPEREGLSP